MNKLHKALALIAPDWKVLERSKNCRTGLHEVRLSNVKEPTRLVEGVGVTEGDAFKSVAKQVLFGTQTLGDPQMKMKLAIATAVAVLLAAPAFAGGIGKYNNPNAETHGHYRFRDANDRAVDMQIEVFRHQRKAGMYDDDAMKSITNIGTMNVLNMGCSSQTVGQNTSSSISSSGSPSVDQGGVQLGNNSSTTVCNAYGN